MVAKAARPWSVSEKFQIRKMTLNTREIARNKRTKPFNNVNRFGTDSFILFELILLVYLNFLAFLFPKHLYHKRF